jgi:hypothetical protein
MKEIRITLVTDGPSDAALIPILTWLLRQHAAEAAFSLKHVDYRLRRKPLRGLENRLAYALLAYPCELLFVHRDAEKQPPKLRRSEIETAIERLRSKSKAVVPPHICVIPVRMTEAWLLLDKQVIRRASGKPNGKVPLDLPRPSKLEALPDPKQVLRDLLTLASESTGRRRKDFAAVRVKEAVQLVANLLKDFSPLRCLSAFKTLEEEIRLTLNDGGFID